MPSSRSLQSNTKVTSVIPMFPHTQGEEIRTRCLLFSMFKVCVLIHIVSWSKSFQVCHQFRKMPSSSAGNNYLPPPRQIDRDQTIATEMREKTQTLARLRREIEHICSHKILQFFHSSLPFSFFFFFLNFILSIYILFHSFESVLCNSVSVSALNLSTTTSSCHVDGNVLWANNRWWKRTWRCSTASFHVDKKVAICYPRMPLINHNTVTPTIGLLWVPSSSACSFYTLLFFLWFSLSLSLSLSHPLSPLRLIFLLGSLSSLYSL